MNDTANHSVMEEYNAPERCHRNLAKCLQWIEENNNTAAVAIDHLKSLTFFMGQFFDYSDLDPDSDNKSVCESSNIRIFHYKHYRNLFEIIANEIHQLGKENELAEQRLERITEEFQRITEIRVS